MKKLNIIVLLAISSLFFVSCEEDDETNFTQPNYLAGKWVPVKIGGLNSQGVLNYQDYQNSADCDLDNLVFNQDSSFEYHDFEFIDNACDDNNIDGTYALDNNRINLVYTDSDGLEVTETRNILSLTFTEMEITYTDSETNQIVFLKLQKQE
jgi:hypothetical protein